MADGTLAALAKRVETEEPSLGFWLGVWEIVNPSLSHPERDRFVDLLDERAYLDAADMLRPEGWRVFSILHLYAGGANVVLADCPPPDHSDRRVISHIEHGPHAEARARLAAAMRARDAGGA